MVRVPKCNEQMCFGHYRTHRQHCISVDVVHIMFMRDTFNNAPGQPAHYVPYH